MDKVDWINRVTKLNKTTMDTFQDNIERAIAVGGVAGDTLPIGSIVPFSSTSIPTNWLLCNGQAVSRTEYPMLFAVIGITYGAGDGETTFNLPNLKGRVPVGLDGNQAEFNTLGETGGEKTHTLTINEMPTHSHENQNHVVSGYARNYRGWIATLKNGTSTDVKGYIATADTNDTGGGQSHNILQPYITINYIIKANQSAGTVANVVDSLNSTSATDALSANQGRILLDLMHPVGSIYMSADNTNPATLFGGTWVAWGSGRVPVGVDTTQTEFNTVEKTGGEKTHTLTSQELPTNTYTDTQATIYTGENTYGSWLNASGGGGQAHNILQPYITCYMWKRTA